MVVIALYSVDHKYHFSVIFCDFRFPKLWKFGFCLFEKRNLSRSKMSQIGIGELEIGTSHRGVQGFFLHVQYVLVVIG